MGIIGIILDVIAVVICIFTSLKWLAIILSIIALIVLGISIFIRLKNNENYILLVVGIIASILVILMSFVFISTNNDEYELNKENVYKVGNVYNGENISIELLSFDINSDETKKYSAMSGYKILKVTFKIENKGETNKLITESDFKCYSNSEECRNFFAGEYNTLDIIPGTKETLNFYYEIPEDANSIKLVYDIGDISNGNVNFAVKTK